MSVREGHALRGKLVRMGCRNLAVFRIEALDVAVAEIVADDVDNVGLLRRKEREDRENEKNQMEEKAEHHATS